MRRLAPTEHALRKIQALGIDADDVLAVFRAPKSTSQVRTRTGQVRLMGRGIVLVGEWSDPLLDPATGRVTAQTFTLVTVYADAVLTPPRPDQLRTPEGRRYAARYRAGLGRG